MSSAVVLGFLGFLFTLLVFSYLLGDNPLFRVTMVIFVGVSAGYAAAVAWHQVLWPQLFGPLLNGNVIMVIPLLLGVLLLTKVSPHLSRLGSTAMAYLVGVGAAVAVGGAVMGTLLPQTLASVNLFDLRAAQASGINPSERLFEASILLVGALATLIYFHFGARPGADGSPQRNPLIRSIARVGEVFIAITFGVLFAGVYAAALTALIERLNFLWTLLISLL